MGARKEAEFNRQKRKGYVRARLQHSKRRCLAG
eukprot:SAG22_NODE_17627_length_301_cov_1.277228_1_plen_32_part_01